MQPARIQQVHLRAPAIPDTPAAVYRVSTPMSAMSGRIRAQPTPRALIMWVRLVASATSVSPEVVPRAMM